VASTSQGSAVWQTLQRGEPEALGRTRFLVPQFGQGMIVLASDITFYRPRGEVFHTGGTKPPSAASMRSYG
jgi:hypothetical protein